MTRRQAANAFDSAEIVCRRASCSICNRNRMSRRRVDFPQVVQCTILPANNSYSDFQQLCVIVSAFKHMAPEGCVTLLFRTTARVREHALQRARQENAPQNASFGLGLKRRNKERRSRNSTQPPLSPVVDAEYPSLALSIYGVRRAARGLRVRVADEPPTSLTCDMPASILLCRVISSRRHCSTGML